MKFFLIQLSLMSLCYANPKGFTNTPVLPESGYRIHGIERPHPKKVSNTKFIHTTAPSDATVLFDGSNIDAWKGQWNIKDGVLIASPGHLETKEHFGKVQIHLEFRIPEGRKVIGQVGANSGIFIMGLYEIQVQESHTNVTYADGQAGAMYGQYPPLVNPSSPQGKWQSYDIIFEPPIHKGKTLIKPAVVTVLHNGVLVHHAQPFLGASTFKKIPKYSKKTLASKGPLKLQWHDDPVEFKNIWIRDLGEYSNTAEQKDTD